MSEPQARRWIEIKARAVKRMDDSEVLVEFYDIDGKKHEFIEEWAVVFAEAFDGSLPKDCGIPCVIIEETKASYTVDTFILSCVASVEGLNRFEVSKDSLSIRDLPIQMD